MDPVVTRQESRARLRDALGPVGAWVNALNVAPATAATRAARRIEELGYPALWVAEGTGTKEVLTHASTLLAATERLVVGSGVASVYGRDPMAAINGARTLADAYHDRFVLGLGISHRPLVEQRGHEHARPLATMRNYLTRARSVPFRVADAPEPTIVLAALRPRMIALAAELADGVHTYLATPEHTGSTRSAVGEETVLITDQPFTLATGAEGLAAARRYLAFHLTLPNYRASLLAMGFTEADLVGPSDRLVTSVVAVGPPRAVAERVAAHHAAGADHVAPHPIDADVLTCVSALEEVAQELPGLV